MDQIRMIEKIKRDLRTKFLKKRILVKNKINKEKKIVKRLKNLLNFNSLLIAVYYSTKSEVNLINFVCHMHKNQQTILLPVINKINSPLLFKEWKADDKLIPGKYGIMTPSTKFYATPKILIVPMLAFDKNKDRLGYGGGYYDRTISFLEKNSKILKFGVAFDEQEIKKVPTMRFDKKMDLILTPTKIII